MQRKTSPPAFEQFLSRMLVQGKLSPQQLLETMGLETANRVLDNANNYMGMPSLGSGTGSILHGQLHEYLGAIPDIKGQIADKLEKAMTQTQAKDEAEQNPAPSPKMNP